MDSSNCGSVFRETGLVQNVQGDIRCKEQFAGIASNAFRALSRQYGKIKCLGVTILTSQERTKEASIFYVRGVLGL